MVVVLFTLIGVMTLFLLYGYLSNWLLGVNEYPMGISNLPRGMEGIKIVHLSDLHGCRFGKENERLLSKIKMIQPNLILMSGDMIVKDGKGSEALIELCKELVKLCPVYYSLGNHETRYDDWLEVQKKLCDMQVIVLDNETLVSDSGFCVAGLTLDAKSYDKIWKKPTVEDGSLEQLLGKKEDMPTILLAHNPEYFEQYVKWGADIVLAGHYHGGIMRLPFRGALAPNLRIFPKYSYGLFEKNDTTMLVSRGLGTHHIKLRFFNNPEICVAILKKRT